MASKMLFSALRFSVASALVVLVLAALSPAGVTAAAAANTSGSGLVTLIGHQAAASPLSGTFLHPPQNFTVRARSGRTAAGPDPARLVHGFTPHGAGTMGNEESYNWAGQFVTGTTFTGVADSWVVPAVVPSESSEYSGSWIGVDGATNSSLIQTGTSQDTTGDQTSYFAWYEILPSAEVPIDAPVDPGDQMSAEVAEVSPGLWGIEIQDLTQEWGYQSTFDYSGPGASVDYIEEAPTIGGEQSTLADFGSVTYSDLELRGLDLTNTSLTSTYMADSAGNVVAYPDNIQSNDSFVIHYGSPPQPTITSVSPHTGSTAGGTTVTISGNGLGYWPTAVDFGGTPAAASINPDTNVITATSPREAAGTVNISVTTIGGTSPPTPSDQFTYVVPPPHGYWLVGSDGGIFTFGLAGFYGSTGSLRLQRPVVGIVPTSNHGGYWLDASDGGVFAFGNAGFYGSIPGGGLHPAGSGLPNSLNAPIVGMVPSADSGGYFMVASDGGVFAFGDAKFAGSCYSIGGCAGAAVAVMPDASGFGYWVVTRTGDVYTFGDAPYYGGPGNVGAPVTSAVRTPDGRGYWILTANGTVYNYGDAHNYGSPGGQYGGFDPATAVFSTSDGAGYWVAAADGSVHAYGDAPNDGSMAGTKLNGAIIAGTGW